MDKINKQRGVIMGLRLAKAILRDAPATDNALALQERLDYEIERAYSLLQELQEGPR